MVADLPRYWKAKSVQYIVNDNHWLCELASIPDSEDEQSISRTIRFPHEVIVGDTLVLTKFDRTGNDAFRIRKPRD